MKWFRAEESTHEESMVLFKEVDKAIDELQESGIEPGAKSVEHQLYKNGIDTQVTFENGKHIVRRR